MGSPAELVAGGKDLNLRPLGYEPNELPDCSTPHCHGNNLHSLGQPNSPDLAAILFLAKAVH